MSRNQNAMGIVGRRPFLTHYVDPKNDMYFNDWYLLEPFVMSMEDSSKNLVPVDTDHLSGNTCRWGSDHNIEFTFYSQVDDPKGGGKLPDFCSEVNQEEITCGAELTY